MIRTGVEYRESLMDEREVWIDGERVQDLLTHPFFNPIIDIRAKMYYMAHEDQFQEQLTYHDEETDELNTIYHKPPRTREDWYKKDLALDALMKVIGGVVIRVNDETVGEMWSLYDGQDVLNEVDPQFARNIERHIVRTTREDPFHVSVNTDPKCDRSKLPQEQDPDMLLHVVKETDSSIVVHGKKFETAAAYSNQAFVKPTIGGWAGNEKLSDYAVSFICEMGVQGLKHICRTGFAGRAPIKDYPLTNRFDEIYTLLVFDNVLIPLVNVLFYRHTKAAAFIRATLHRYSAYPFILRIRYMADMMIGAALFNAKQTGLEKNPTVREKLAKLACYREGINAHLTASILLEKKSPGGLLMPNQ